MGSGASRFRHASQLLPDYYNIAVEFTAGGAQVARPGIPFSLSWSPQAVFRAKCMRVAMASRVSSRMSAALSSPDASSSGESWLGHVTSGRNVTTRGKSDCQRGRRMGKYYDPRNKTRKGVKDETHYKRILQSAIIKKKAAMSRDQQRQKQCGFPSTESVCVRATTFVS